MIVLPPKVTHDELNNPQFSFPDNAPADYIAARFDGANYTFYERGDTVPPSASP